MGGAAEDVEVDGPSLEAVDQGLDGLPDGVGPSQLEVTVFALSRGRPIGSIDSPL